MDERAKVVSGIAVSTPYADIENGPAIEAGVSPANQEDCSSDGLETSAMRFRYSPELQKWPL